LDVSGVAALHSHVCFEAEQARAALARVEDRAAVLQAEVDDLKLFVATHSNGVGGQSGHGRAPSGSISSLPAGVPGATTARSEDGGAATGRSVPPAPPAEVVKREVVDVKVMTDLQHKLTSLIQVHRQLLRKYAVVDVECGEMAEGLKARDDRIADLVKASLAHNAAMNALRDQYEDEMEGLRKEYVDQLRQLRSELLTLHAPPAAGSGAAPNSGRPTARSAAAGGSGHGATTTATSARSAAPSASDDFGGVGAGVTAAGLAALRTRHLVKPLRGHTTAATAAAAATYRLALGGGGVGPGSLPGVTEEDTDRSTDEVAAEAAGAQAPSAAGGNGGAGGGASGRAGGGDLASLPSSRLQALFATSSAMAAGQAVR
jgi:hypothetical protein